MQAVWLTQAIYHFISDWIIEAGVPTGLGRIFSLNIFKIYHSCISGALCRCIFQGLSYEINSQYTSLESTSNAYISGIVSY